MAAPLPAVLSPVSDDVLELLAELSDDVCAEVVRDVASVAEAKLDDVLSSNGSLDAASKVAVAFDVLSPSLFRRLPLDSSDEFDAASDASVGNEVENCESEICELMAGCPARCSASSNSPKAPSADDAPRLADDCPKSGYEVRLSSPNEVIGALERISSLE